MIGTVKAGQVWKDKREPDRFVIVQAVENIVGRSTRVVVRRVQGPMGGRWPKARGVPVLESDFVRHYAQETK